MSVPTIDALSSVICACIETLAKTSIKINLYLRPAIVQNPTIGGTDPANIKSYYQNYYEIVGITNDMTDGRFFQHLLLAKRDDII